MKPSMSAVSWKRVKISELCDTIVDCVNRTAPTAVGPTPYRMIRTSNVKGGRINLDDTKYVTLETYQRWTRRQVPQRGDIILTREAPLGEVGIIRNEGQVFLGQRLVAYRANKAVAIPEFIFYALQGVDLQGQIAALGSGSTVEHMRVPDAKELVVATPPLNIQRRIADILSAYDDLIETNRRRITVLEEMARRLFEEWFVRFQFPEAGKRRKVPPQNWQIRPFSSAVDVMSGGTPRKAEPMYWNGRIPFFTPTDARQRVFALETADSITELGLSKCASRSYEPWTVFITARGTVGRVLLAGVPMAMNQSCYALRGKGGYPQTFVYELTVQAASTFRQMAHGAVFDTIIKDTFDKYEVRLPPVSLAQAYDRLARPMYEAILVHIKEIAALRAARDLLLPGLISGEIDLKLAERKSEGPIRRVAAA